MTDINFPLLYVAQALEKLSLVGQKFGGWAFVYNRSESNKPKMTTQDMKYFGGIEGYVSV